MISIGHFTPKQWISPFSHGTFSRIDHILGHESNLEKFKKTEIILSIFSDHNALRLDLNYRRKTITNSNIRRLNNTLLINQTKEEEVGNLPEKEFQILIGKMIQNLEIKMESQINSLETRIEKMQERFNKDLEEIKESRYIMNNQ